MLKAITRPVMALTLTLSACRGGSPHVTTAPADLVGRYFAAYVAAVQKQPNATEEFMAFYADSMTFEDPTARLAATGRSAFRTRIVEPNLRVRFANVRWTLSRRVDSGDWVAVEGAFSALVNGSPMTRRFTTWLRFKDGRIVHHIDYFSKP